jgi:hypothetical protein
MSRRPVGALAVTALVALAATGCSTYAALVAAGVPQDPFGSQ